MLRIKVFLLVLCLVSVIATNDKLAEEREWIRGLLEELENENSPAQPQARRNHLNQDDDNSEDEVFSNRRSHHNNMEDGYLELRARGASKATNTGPVITLQNRALMNTRLRVLYTDDKCEPFLAESGLLMTLQTKSVRLPINAQHVKIIVEKDLFAEKWRVAYNGTLNNLSECIRITGATFSSKIEPCK